MKRKPDPSTDIPPDSAGPEPFVLETPIADAIATDPPPPPPEPIPPLPPRSGILAPLLGGALAAVAGFGLAYFDVFALRSDDRIDLATLDARQAEALAALKAEQSTGLDALAARIDELAQRVNDADSLPAGATIDPAQLAALDSRLKAIEALPPVGDAALAPALADLDRRVAALGEAGTLPAELTAKVEAALAKLATAEAAATTRAEDAETVAEAIRQRMALEDLRAVVDSGAPFGTQLAAVTDPDLQAALSGASAAGLATLSALQASFPDAARAALSRARDIDTADGWGTRLLDFLAAQTGARSLAPREGADPDAILSRAEAAVRDNRLPDALTELATLDPAIAAPLADWTASAQSRIAAEQALDAAAARLQGSRN